MLGNDNSGILGNIAGRFLCTLLQDEATETTEVNVFVIDEGVLNGGHESFYDYKGGRFVFNKTWDAAGNSTHVDTTVSVPLVDGGGDNNIVVEEAGTYEITATFAGGTCTKIVITKK